MRAGALALLALLAAPAAARAQGQRAWSVVSANAEFEAAQVAVGEAGCRVEVRRGERTVVWAVDRCLGSAGDLYFLSNTGERLVALRTFPPKASDRPAGLKAAVGVEVFARGERVAVHRVGACVVDVRPLVNTRKHFYWIEGALGQPGVPPGPTKLADAIQFSTLDRRSWSVGFDGKLKKAAPVRHLGR